ncbi:efflux RND transporter periplasmic adaptor subunit [Pseudoalteromonas aurantia]|uniref:Efflux transporter periplasmic adaptor subunit n=1 Tax=Pseudoalteromonas aurantia TaxID=43654 RepID=A0A5S3V7B0_9GAMM|nr:efflux RND transporter periplasmic adaptor subunit [Pseudoalteromonas aurantia]TMO67012.1 efflux transporter periplasmic adaptor subunit [Pseudoalteromonas aurantia]TMO67379.1 efflux transporter periplasmic adaptor subunit [Pseudoalteromonas aurantia]TMO74722.1 efflux transporter periplasmic adaptor subunit [Pseudoalteromonas aurantia]
MKKLIIGLSIVLGITALVGVKKSQKAETVDVVVATSQKGILEQSILASGNFVYGSNVQIRSEVTGRVIEVLVKEGQKVNAGDLLVRLDDSAFSARVNRAEAQVRSQQITLKRNEEVYKNNKRKLERHSELFTSNLVGQDLIDELRTQLRIAKYDIQAAKQGLGQAQASLKEATQELAKTEFRAPISGVITQVGVKEGETVVAGTTNIIGSALLELAEPKSLEVELRVDEADIGNIKLGQQVKVFSAMKPKDPIMAKVAEISPLAKRIDKNRGLVMLLKLELGEHDQKLFAGMSCRAEVIHHHSNPAVHIPIAAVLQDTLDDSEHYVWTVKDSRATRQLVSLGISNDTQQVVLDGLGQDQLVITGPGRTLYSLRENMRVNTSSL